MGSESKSARGTEYPTTPLLLEKAPKKHNILVGEDAAQTRFAEQFLSHRHGAKVQCQFVEALCDDHVLGQEQPTLHRVERASQIELSPSVRAKVGVWALDIIEKGSAGANAIVREGARLMGLGRPDRQTADHVAAETSRIALHDVHAAIWEAAWLLSGPPHERRQWPHPWENYITWLPEGEDPRFRLNTLYWTLVEYVFAAEGDEGGFRKTGRPFRPKEFRYLSSLVLPKQRVYDTLAALSAWRSKGGDPYSCALRVAKIWERQ